MYYNDFLNQWPPQLPRQQFRWYPQQYCENYPHPISGQHANSMSNNMSNNGQFVSNTAPNQSYRANSLPSRPYEASRLPRTHEIGPITLPKSEDSYVYFLYFTDCANLRMVFFFSNYLAYRSILDVLHEKYPRLNDKWTTVMVLLKDKKQNIPFNCLNQQVNY